MLMRFQLGKLNVPAVQPEAGIQLYVYKTNQHGFRVLIIEQSGSNGSENLFLNIV